MQKYMAYNDNGDGEIVHFFDTELEACEFVKKYKKNFRNLEVRKSAIFEALENKGLFKYRFEFKSIEDVEIMANSVAEATKKAEILWDEFYKGKHGGFKLINYGG